MNLSKDNNKIMTNNVMTVNFDNVKYRLVIGQRFFTGYFKDGTKPQRYDIFDDAMIEGFLTLAVITGKAPLAPVVHTTKKNTFVWGGLEKQNIERYDEQSKRYIVSKLTTKHGRELARAILRRTAQKAAA